MRRLRDNSDKANVRSFLVKYFTLKVPSRTIVDEQTNFIILCEIRANSSGCMKKKLLLEDDLFVFRCRVIKEFIISADPVLFCECITFRQLSSVYT